MDREEIRAELRPYLEGLLTPDEVKEIERFLEETPGARQILAEMMAEEDVMAERVSRARQGEESIRDVSGRISRDTRMAAMGTASRRSSRRTRRWLWLGVAGLAVLVLFLYQWKGDAPGDWLVTAPIDDMRTVIEAERGADVASADAETVRTWFTGRVNFTAPRPPLGDGTAALIGGRLAFFLERRVAAYMYEVDGHPLTLYVMARHAMPDTEMDGIVYAPLEDRMPEGLDGYRQVIWTIGPLFYSLTANLPRDWLIEIANGFVTGGD